VTSFLLIPTRKDGWKQEKWKRNVLRIISGALSLICPKNTDFAIK